MDSHGEPSACRPQALLAFTVALQDLGTTRGLVCAAAALALHEQPDAPVGTVFAQLGALAARVRARCASGSTQALLAHAHAMLFDEDGFRGDSDDYHATRNSYVHSVLERRRGMPITLVLVYKAVLEELGIPVRGIGAPGHFLASVEVEGRPAFVDVFHGGEVLSLVEACARVSRVLGRPVEPDPVLLPTCTHDAWLRRMLRNLQAAFQRVQRPDCVHAMQELELVLEFHLRRRD